MDEQQARLILESYRPGVDLEDAEIVAALETAGRNPESARWLEEEQAFDRAIGEHIQSIPAPYGLKTRILARRPAPVTSRFARLILGLAGAVALLFLLAQVADLWRNRGAESSNLLPAYASEMVSFIKVAPSLDLVSPNLRAIMGWLEDEKAIPPHVPVKLALLDPVGCRVLSFRQHDVTLICFNRESGKLAHLFVVDRAALPGLKPGAAVVFQREGEWMTATWAENDQVYMIAVQGDEAAARRFLPRT
ncbi:MAG: hypothetical protein ABI540_06135 [Spartobacteria bacterium]